MAALSPSNENAPTASRLRVAVLAPCFNEAAAIGAVVRDFRRALPHADIYVYDNASTDKTADIANASGAIVRTETRRGKGNVVRRMLSDVEADLYVMVDGDDTYDADAAPGLIHYLLAEKLDMVVGARRHASDAAYRPGHQFGNRMLTSVIAGVFGADLKDMLSGYRVMTRRFVKSFPALSRGFEVETELTVHALEIGAPFGEVETNYKERPAGSASKLRTVRDGARIGRFIARLVREERPMEFFGGLGAAMIAVAAFFAAPVLVEYLDTGLVPRLPTWVAATALVVMGFFSLTCGLILDTVTKGRREARRLAYLALSAPQAPAP